MEQRTLGSLVGQSTEKSDQRNDTTSSFNAYLTIFAINLVHRFPEVTDLNTIDTTVVNNVARLCTICSTIAVNTWNELLETQEQVRRHIRERRAA